MSTTREDLVALVLGALPGPEADRLREEIARDPAALREGEEIRRHLTLHDAMPRLVPRPGLFSDLRRQIEAEPPRRSLWRRYALTWAAAALVLLAFILPPFGRAGRLVTLHGEIVKQDGGWRCAHLARIRIGDEVTATLDAGTEIALPAPRRLALRAGRVHLAASPIATGFSVETPEVTAVVTGTVFSVGRNGGATTVAVQEGRIRCDFGGKSEILEAPAALRFAAGSASPAPMPDERWMRTPSLQATLLDPATLRIVVVNEMPDPITLAPPTGGEPLFFIRVDGREIPLSPSDAEPIAAGEVAIPPGDRITLTFRLPRPVPEGEEAVVSWGGGAVRAVAGKAR